MATQATHMLLMAVALVSLSSCSSNESCPTWLYLSGEGGCTCGSSLLGVILCSNETQEISILPSYCLTSWDSGSNPDKAVVGSCLYGQNHGKRTGSVGGIYVSVNQNITEQDQELCGYLNREGRLCGLCKPNHFVPVYSYDFKCYKCHGNLAGNIVTYLTVAYVPLTVFLIVVMMFRISVTSPHLHVAVLFCQIYTLPEIQRVLIQNTRHTTFSIFLDIIGTVYGVWNLDFFRTFTLPICLPLNTMQVIALDYLLALYPLILLLCFYKLALAHDKGYKLALKLWRPFLWCSVKLRHTWNVKHSIIDAFATFLVLSYMKFLNTSIDLMIPTTVTDVHGSRLGYFFYYDATIEFMGSQHLPYAIIAMAVLLIGLLFPLMLLIYPMKWFQKLLNTLNLNSPGLRAFMECFQGNYRDRTDGGWECRYFSAVYPIFRIGVSLFYALTRNDLFFPIEVVMSVVVITSLQVVRPYKKQCRQYKTLDTLLLMSLIGFSAGIVMRERSVDWYQLCNEACPTIGMTISVAFGLAPLAYFVTLLWKKVKKPLLKFKDACQRRKRQDYEELSVANPLLNSASRDGSPLSV